ncbi:sulfite exporter TauE/SafE family protein [Oceanicella sp. SM1341]|uniref:sulfite exporter TauE/SafE family protein n=1 Tax=Oceanicella sp. SM1341 TaxID=1548889 RepID=UPI000E4DDBBA|nr:sulfite exporter TauE/SafE family protein [Oceanicella sp. SM1341]
MPELSVLLPLLGVLLAVGFFAGIVAGLLGVGGGIVLVPVFYWVFASLGHVPDQLMQICVATSLGTIVFTSIRSVLSHARRGAVDFTILRQWGPGIVIGSALGVVIAAGLKSHMLMLVFGVLGCIVGVYMALGREHWRLGQSMPGLLGRSIASPVIGFLSVLMGIGGGSFGVPLMTLYNQPIHRAVATAAGFGVLIAVPSFIGFLLTGWGIEDKPPFTVGYVNIPAFVIVVAMTLISAPIGVRLAHALPAKPLKRIFAVFIFLMAVNMLVKALGA